jgi:hypothetical protein
LDFSEFYLELNVCGLNLNVIQIQTKLQNYIQSICKILTSDVGLFPCEQSAHPTNPQPAEPSSPSDAAQRPHNTAAFFLSLADVWDPRVGLSSFFFFFTFFPSAALHRTAPCRAAPHHRACDGTAGPLPGTHAECDTLKFHH